ncbi:MAG: glycyl-radical enzyme activating protein [Candidatus Hydrogenedentota bacterium]|nr:MAG: glycyl-radical enzyme activating protein [Candidatus Hydrogenedentota bacterium]
MENNKATIFDIQRYSVHDGPGIRTLVFFKGCPLRCKWCQNPESLDRDPEIAFFSSKCIGCGECGKACPKEAIVFEDGERIRRSKCDRCGKCADVCYAEALTVIGKEYDVRTLLDVVERDRPFYEQSGGGVTVSGGEPTVQLEFLLDFLRAAKEAGLNTVIETCGAFAWSRFKRLLPYLDIIYFDLKVVDEKEHKRLTGVNNRRILANARKLVESREKVVFRVPLVPGMTVTETNISGLINLLTGLEQREVHLLPYHKMGESKLQRIDCTLQPLDLAPFSDEQIAEIRSRFESAGINVSIGGS